MTRCGLNIGYIDELILHVFLENMPNSFSLLFLLITLSYFWKVKTLGKMKILTNTEHDGVNLFPCKNYTFAQ